MIWFDLFSFSNKNTFIRYALLIYMIVVVTIFTYVIRLDEMNNAPPWFVASISFIVTAFLSIGLKASILDDVDIDPSLHCVGDKIYIAIHNKSKSIVIEPRIYMWVSLTEAENTTRILGETSSGYAHLPDRPKKQKYSCTLIEVPEKLTTMVATTPSAKLVVGMITVHFVTNYRSEVSRVFSDKSVIAALEACEEYKVRNQHCTKT